MRRPVRETYLKLSEALGDPQKLSLRKQFCLQFLKWGVTTRKEDKTLFVELAKLWRKQESRLGSDRTLLERKARKLFPKENKKKKLTPSREGARKHGLMQKEEGIGIHDPELKAQQRLEASRYALKVRMEKNAHPNMMEWIVHNRETKETRKIVNLRKFCRDNNLDMRHMWMTVRVPGAYHKNWRAERFSSEWENL